MKIVFNGSEYDGPEAMPVEVRVAYEAALALAGRGGATVPGVHVTVNVKRRVRYNGVEYEDVDQLPEEVRQQLGELGGQIPRLAPKRLAQRRSTPGEMLALGVLLGTMLLALLLYLGEYRALEYTFDDDRLFVWGAAFGILVAWPVLRRLLPALTRLPPIGRTVYGLFLIFFLTLAGAPVACLVNRKLASAPVQPWSFTITDKRHIAQRGRSPSTWEIRAQAGGRALRFEVPPSLWNRLQVGHSYTGTVRKGYLGYSFLAEAGLH